jgi:hypothetical protein
LLASGRFSAREDARPTFWFQQTDRDRIVSGLALMPTILQNLSFRMNGAIL